MAVLTLDLIKHWADSRNDVSPDHRRLWKRHLEKLGFWASEEYFGPLSNSQVLFLSLAKVRQ